MVIAYAMHALSWQMSKRMSYQPWVGLPNILLRDFVVPELLQDDATPGKLAAAALRWLDDPARAARRCGVRFERTLHHDTAALRHARRLCRPMPIAASPSRAEQLGLHRRRRRA